MYLNDTDLLNASAKQKLAAWQQDAATHRRLRPLRTSYRLRLARSLQRLAEKLEPKKEVKHAHR